jgi:hypothetical protein
VLSPDISSKRHVQWFYFAVSNMRAGVLYTFHIVNFVKKYSMFQFGMKPLCYDVAASGTVPLVRSTGCYMGSVLDVCPHSLLRLALRPAGHCDHDCRLVPCRRLRRWSWILPGARRLLRRGAIICAYFLACVRAKQEHGVLRVLLSIHVHRLGRLCGGSGLVDLLTAEALAVPHGGSLRLRQPVSRHCD